MPISVSASEVKLIPNMRSVMHIDEADTTLGYVLSAAVAELGTVAEAGTTGKFLCSALPDYLDAPFVLKRSVGDDLVVGAIKIRGASMYYYGVPAPKVINFTPPARGEYQPVADWQTVNVTLDGLLSASPLEDTETAKLKTKFEQILSVTPLFAEPKLTKAILLEKHAAKGFAANFKQALIAAEKREREAAKQKGANAQDAGVSAGAGQDAKKRWAEITAAILSHEADFMGKFFPESFFVVGTSEQQEAMKAQFKGLNEEEALLESLEKFIDKNREAPQLVNVLFEELLEKKPVAEAPPRQRAEPNRFEAGAARGTARSAGGRGEKRASTEGNGGAEETAMPEEEEPVKQKPRRGRPPGQRKEPTEDKPKEGTSTKKDVATAARIQQLVQGARAHPPRPPAMRAASSHIFLTRARFSRAQRTPSSRPGRRPTSPRRRRCARASPRSRASSRTSRTRWT